MAQQNFKALKKRIIMTDELIVRYWESQRSLKECQSKLLSWEHCAAGLKLDVETLHNDKEELRSQYVKCLKERDLLRENMLSEELLSRQLTAQNTSLTAQVSSLKLELESYSELKNAKMEMTELKMERDKLRERCVKLMKSREAHLADFKQQLLGHPSSHKVRGNSDSGFPPGDLPSPPYSCSTVSSDPKSCAAELDVEFPTMDFLAGDSYGPCNADIKFSPSNADSALSTGSFVSDPSEGSSAPLDGDSAPSGDDVAVFGGPAEVNSALPGGDFARSTGDFAPISDNFVASGGPSTGDSGTRGIFTRSLGGAAPCVLSDRNSAPSGYNAPCGDNYFASSDNTTARELFGDCPSDDDLSISDTSSSSSEEEEEEEETSRLPTSQANALSASTTLQSPTSLVGASPRRPSSQGSPLSLSDTSSDDEEEEGGGASRIPTSQAMPAPSKILSLSTTFRSPTSSRGPLHPPPVAPSGVPSDSHVQAVSTASPQHSAPPNFATPPPLTLEPPTPSTISTLADGPMRSNSSWLRSPLMSQSPPTSLTSATSSPSRTVVECVPADQSGENLDEEEMVARQSPSVFSGAQDPQQGSLSPLPPSPPQWRDVISPIPSSPPRALSPLPSSPTQPNRSPTNSPINAHHASARSPLSPLPPSPVRCGRPSSLNLLTQFADVAPSQMTLEGSQMEPVPTTESALVAQPSLSWTGADAKGGAALCVTTISSVPKMLTPDIVATQPGEGKGRDNTSAVVNSGTTILGKRERKAGCNSRAEASSCPPKCWNLRSSRQRAEMSASPYCSLDHPRREREEEVEAEVSFDTLLQHARTKETLARAGKEQRAEEQAERIRELKFNAMLARAVRHQAERNGVTNARTRSKAAKRQDRRSREQSLVSSASSNTGISNSGTAPLNWRAFRTVESLPSQLTDVVTPLDMSVPDGEESWPPHSSTSAPNMSHHPRSRSLTPLGSLCPNPPHAVLPSTDGKSSPPQSPTPLNVSAEEYSPPQSPAPLNVVAEEYSPPQSPTPLNVSAEEYSPPQSPAPLNVVAEEYSPPQSPTPLTVVENSPPQSPAPPLNMDCSPSRLAIVTSIDGSVGYGEPIPSSSTRPTVVSTEIVSGTRAPGAVGYGVSSSAAVGLCSLVGGGAGGGETASLREDRQVKSSGHHQTLSGVPCPAWKGVGGGDNSDGTAPPATLPSSSKELSRANLKSASPVIPTHRKTLPTPVTQHHQAHHQAPPVSIAQRQLNKAMQCPLPLPQWLVAAMTEVQAMYLHCSATAGYYNQKKKRKDRLMVPIQRNGCQDPVNYVAVNLERLSCGHLYLDPIISMFTQPSNVPSVEVMVSGILQFFLKYYNPKIEHVVAMFHKQCDILRSKNPFLVETRDPNFAPALLRPECQLVALLAHVCRLKQDLMGSLLDRVSRALYEAMMEPGIYFHKLMSMARVFTALIRLQANPDQLLSFVGDLLKKPLLPNELHVIGGVASVWPAPLCRAKGVALFKTSGQQKLSREGLESQMMSYTLEVLVMTKYLTEGKKAGIQESFPRNLLALCGWTRNVDCKRLCCCLMEIMKESPNIYIDSTPCGNTPWQQPRPSVTAYQIVRCLNLVCRCKGWAWTNDFLIAKHLWPILQQWNGKKTGAGSAHDDDVVRDCVVVCILRLIGFIASFGVREDPSSTSIGQLQRVLMALLKESCTKHISLTVQLAALDSLLEILPVASPSASAPVVGVVRAWLNAQMQHPWGPVISSNLQNKLHIP